MTALEEAGRSPNVIRQAKVVLGAMFTKAVANGYLGDNPFHGVKTPKVRGPRSPGSSEAEPAVHSVAVVDDHGGGCAIFEHADRGQRRIHIAVTAWFAGKKHTNILSLIDVNCHEQSTTVALSSFARGT